MLDTFAPAIVNGHIDDRPSAYGSAEQAHALVVAAIQQIEHLFIQVGRALVVVHDAQLHRVLGHDTFGSYLASPDVRLSRTHAYRLMDLARSLRPIAGTPAIAVSDQQLARLGVTRVALVLPLLKAAPAEAETWLAKAAALTTGDLRLEVRQVQEGGLTQRQEAADELARKLLALAYRLRQTADPEAVLDELIAVAVEGRAWLAQLSEQVTTMLRRDARLATSAIRVVD